MEKPLAQKLRKIAKRVRCQAEKIAEQYGFGDDLESFCGHGAQLLFRELCKAGYRPQLVVCHDDEIGHCFVRVRNYIVDITASQFCCFPNVCVRNRNINYQHWGKENPRYGKMHIAQLASIRAFRGYLRRDQWPSDQIVLEG